MWTRLKVFLAGAYVVALAVAGLPRLWAQEPARAGGNSALAPPASDGTGAISGVVTDASTHQPLAGVLVYLGLQGKGAVGRLSRQVSDEQGRFVFTDLPAASLYFINASKPGYIESRYGQGAGGQLGSMMEIADGQWFSHADFSMSRPGAISGRVVDEYGEPAAGVFVRVLARVRVGGRMQLAAGLIAKTDDLGGYRIAGLAPGSYFIQIPSVQQSIPAAMTAAEMAGIVVGGAAPNRPIPDPLPALDFGAASRLIVGGYATPPPHRTACRKRGIRRSSIRMRCRSPRRRRST